MEPLAVIGGLRATVDVLDVAVQLSQSVTRTIRAWRDAPDEILALNNSIASLTVVLERAKEVHLSMREDRGAQALAGFSDSLNDQLRAAVGSLQRLAEYSAQVASPRAVFDKARQRARWVRMKSDVAVEARRIQEARENVNNILASYTAYSVTSTHQKLDAILIGVQHLRSAEPGGAEQNTQHTKPERVLGELLRHLQPRSEIHDPRLPGPGRGPVAFAAQYRGARCPRSCLCQCHTRSGGGLGGRLRFHAKNPLGGLIGSLFVEYRGPLPLLGPRCDTPGCWQRGRWQVEVTYTFPLWLIHYAVYAHLTAITNKPTFGLVFRGRVGNQTGNVFYNIELANLTLLRRCLESDPYLVNLLHVVRGSTPLRLAVIHNFVEGARLLLQYGANPDVEDDQGITPGMNAAMVVLSKVAPAAAIEQWCGMFSIARHIEELELPHVTMVVTGWRPGDLESASIQKDELDAYDQAGWTPLYWAATRGDAVATRKLLQLGADVNKTTTEGKTPLMASLGKGNHSDGFAILLDHGARIDLKDGFGIGAIHFACAHGHLEAVKSLLAAGVYVDEPTGSGSTGLVLTGHTDAVDVARLMIKKGANVNSICDFGFTALTNATARNAHRCTALFLDSGADYLHVAKYDGATVLHYAAAGGDVETMDILAAYGLRGSDLSLRNNAGMTAQQCFHNRTDVSPELRAAFSRLLDAVSAANNGTGLFHELEIVTTGAADVDDDDDEFFDALES